MSAPNSPERNSDGEDINTLSEEATASAELVLDETNLIWTKTDKNWLH